jgi:hypothetical protein
VFSLIPGVVNTDVPWNYGKSEGMQIYFASTNAIEPKCNGVQMELEVFLKSVSFKAKIFGWDTMILKIPDNDAVDRNLI